MVFDSPKRNNNLFQPDNRFGPNIPIIEPDVTVNASISKMASPPALHVTVKLIGDYAPARFVYESEEYIEIKDLELDPNLEDLVSEVRKSVERCFRDAHAKCVEQGFAFPFSSIPPDDFDLTEARRNLQVGLDVMDQPDK